MIEGLNSFLEGTGQPGLAELRGLLQELVCSNGAGALLGLGWDLRVGDNVSMTPFWNGFAVQNSDVDANVGQIGLSVTLH